MLIKSGLFLYLFFNISTLSFSQAGLLDSTFDFDGKVSVNNFVPAVNAMAIQSDGKIIIAGKYPDSTITDIACIRLNNDGSPDASFSGDGIATMDFLGIDETATDVVIQQDGKILVLGYRYDGTAFEGVLLRYYVDGMVDSSWDQDGILFINFNVPGNTSTGTALSLQPDGKIMVLGISASDVDGDIALARLNTDGSPDNSFGDNGVVISFSPDNDFASALMLQPDGKIIVAGRKISSLNPDDPKSVIRRFNSDGSPDASFATNGKLVTNFFPDASELCFAIAVQDDGKILVPLSNDELVSNFIIIRLNEDGSTDLSYGINGIASVDFDVADIPHSIFLQPDGKPVVSGVTLGNSYLRDFAVTRLNTDGFTDLSFGTNGIVITDFSGMDEGFSSGLSPDGKIIIAGRSFISPHYNLIASRYLSDVATSNETTFPPLASLSVSPNPCSLFTTIEFSLSENSDVKFELFDLHGIKMKSIAERNFEKGIHQVFLQKENLRSGVYLLQLSEWTPSGKTTSGVTTQKLIIQ